MNRPLLDIRCIKESNVRFVVWLNKDIVEKQPMILTDIKTIGLVKDGHQFIFKYEIGKESLVLDALIEAANSKDNPLDWFDVATLSYCVGQILAKELIPHGKD